jgi:non-specific serine/threonine protein kinase
LRHHPLEEESYRRLMRLYLTLGDRAGVAATYRHCQRVLRRELGVEPSAATLELLRRAEEKREDRPTPRPGAKARYDAPTNLPAQTTSFVGREHEVATLSGLLRRPLPRLVTLLGTPGTGKTRLAIQVASGLLRPATRIFFVPLAPLDAPEQVERAIAQALDLTESGTANLHSQVLNALRQGSTLLLLDNFEHLLPAAGLVSELLAACPDLKILATSRIPLNLRGEHEFQVPPLALPARDLPAEPEALAQYEAVALFVDRAGEVAADFTLNRHNTRDVAEICRHLEGLPLAIELAAARVKVLSPASILARLDRRLKLLVGGKVDMPTHQRTLATAIEWSYNLLDEREQSLFRALSVFAGGCSLESVEAVAADPVLQAGAPAASDGAAPAPTSIPIPAPRSDALDRLTSLLTKSLLARTETPHGEPRFTMLEMLKEFAGEHLEAKGEADLIRLRHADYFTSFAESAQQSGRDSAGTAWLARLDQEHDNLRAALRWTIDARQPALALRLVAALARFWELRGHFNEGLAWVREALAVAGDHPDASDDLALYKATALSIAGLIAERQGDHHLAKEMHTQSVELFSASGDKAGLAGALNNLALLEAYSDEALAIDLHLRTLRLRKEIGDREGMAVSLVNLGKIHMVRGELPQAYSYAEQALAANPHGADTPGVAGALYVMGSVKSDLGELDRAASLLEEAYRIARNLDYRWLMARTLLGWGQTLYLLGDYERATGLYREAAAIYSELHDGWGLALAQVAIGREAHRNDHLDEAIGYYRQALSIGLETRDSFVCGLALGGLAGILSARDRLREAARLFGFADRVSGGTLERYAITLGLVEGKLRSDHAEPGAWDAAWTEGREMPQDRLMALVSTIS